jgi:hypothetical protein
MAIRYVAGEEDCGMILRGVTMTTTAGHFHPDLARAAFRLDGGADFRSSMSAPGNLNPSGWLHYRFFTTGFAAGQNEILNFSYQAISEGGSRPVVFRLVNVAGTTRLRLVSGSLEGMATGTVLADSGDYSLPLNTLVEINIRFVGETVAGQIEVYIGTRRILQYNGTTRTNPIATVSAPEWKHCGTGTVSAVSDIIMTDLDTDARSILGLKTMPVTGIRSENEWTGTWGTLSGVAVDDDTGMTAIPDDLDVDFTTAGLNGFGAGIPTLKILALVPAVRGYLGTAAQSFTIGPCVGDIRFASWSGLIRADYTSIQGISDTHPYEGVPWDIPLDAPLGLMFRTGYNA